MQLRTARRFLVATFMAIGSAAASSSPEDSGVSVAGGYSQVKVSVPSLGGSVTPSGTDFAARAVYSFQGAFAKAEYQRLDTSARVVGVKLNGRVEETRFGLGYALPVAPGLKIFPAADYVIARVRVYNSNFDAHECDHGYFVGGGLSYAIGETTLYGRAGYYHVSNSGNSTTGPDALAGIGIDLSPEAAVFLESRYAPISAPNVDYEALAIRAGVKLKF